MIVEFKTGRVSRKRRNVSFIILIVLLIILGAAWWPHRYMILPLPGVSRSIKVAELIREYQIYLPEPVPGDSGPMPVVMLLQGFDSPKQSDDTRLLFWSFCQLADANRFALVMPRGWIGAFPEIPEVLAWYPDFFSKNLHFLQELASKLNNEPGAGTRFAPQRLFFCGYSNAAYFGALALMNFPDLPFKGYWLEAGGFPYAFNPAVPRQKIFLNVGRQDIYNIEHIRELAAFLTEAGWEPGKNFIYREHEGPHSFDFGASKEALRFFQQ